MRSSAAAAFAADIRLSTDSSSATFPPPFYGSSAASTAAAAVVYPTDFSTNVPYDQFGYANFSAFGVARPEMPFDHRPTVLSASQQPPPVNDPCAHLVQVLLCYHQGGEDPDFIRKAIESLVKKLKDKRTELDALISAVTSGGKQNTGCVTINRSLDGRLQVAGRKGVPHVVYARIWRWPNVSKNELQKLPVCGTSADDPDLICINPFHYDRVVSSTLGNIDMHSMRMDPLGESSTETTLDSNEFETQFEGVGGAADRSASSSSFLIYGPHQQPSYVVSHLPSGDTVGTLTNRQSSEESANWNPDEFHSFGFPKTQNSFGVKRYDSFRYNLDRVRIPSTNPTPFWCSISYYELDTQVGQTFKVPKEQNQLSVDGGMNPAGGKLGRFCLGALPNVHRSEASEKARIHIGRGIQLRHAADGSVFLQCLSQKGVFVRSYFLDFENGLIYGSTVHKFCVNSEKKIFDLRWAFAEMCEQRQSAQMAVAAQAYAVAGITQSAVTPSVMERAGTGVDDLRRVCCTIAVSFVKGWGAGYNRSTIKETPCWIELQLHRPLQLLNDLLRNTD